MIWRSWGATAARFLLLSCFIQRIASMINFGREGDACNRADSNWYAVPQSKHHFIYCHSKHGIYVRDQCALASGVRKVFDAELQQCVMPPTAGVQDHSLPQSSNQHSVGVITRCNNSSQCTDERWVCSREGRCVCRSDHVQIGTNCWKKIPIDGGECVFDKQCSASWPTARCVAKRCMCPTPTVAVHTYHGTVCTAPDECPVGGRTAILMKSRNCHMKGGCGEYTNVNHFYDCLQVSPTNSMCCPNRAYTCMLPVMPGNGPNRFLRYYYDASLDLCQQFTYRGGNLVNTNVFKSRTECESYCRSDCPRGLVERTASGSRLECTSDNDCSPLYACHRRDNAPSGFCCPTSNYLCSKDGGRDYTGEPERFDEFDAGTSPQHATSVFFPVVRFYYSPSERRCKAFLYQGEGGNFNHFVTIEHCQHFCSPVTCDGGQALSLDGKTRQCSSNEQCPVGYSCRYSVCCPMKERFCPQGHEVLLKAETFNSSYWDGEAKIAQRCTQNADCPLPYHCQVDNTILHGTTTGFCCKPIHKPLIFTKGTKLKEPIRGTPHTVYVTTTTVIPTTATEVLTTTTPESTTVTLPSTSSSTMSVPPAAITTPTIKTTVTILPPEIATTSTAFTTTTTPIPPGDREPYCAGGRLPLIDIDGRAFACQLGALDKDCVSVAESLLAAAKLPIPSVPTHRCAFSSLNATIGVCCGTLRYEQHRCPPAMRPMLDTEKATVLSCSPYHLESCPGYGAACVFDELYGSYHCCHIQDDVETIVVDPDLLSTVQATTSTSTATPVATTTQTTTTTEAPLTAPPPTGSPEIPENNRGCQLGQEPFDDPLLNRTLECQPERAATCPPGFACYKSRLNRRFQCCGFTSRCPSNSGAHVSPATELPVGCNEYNGCSMGFFCYRTAGEEIGTCCSEDPVTGLCDHGVALRDAEGKGVRCHGTATCPRGYACLTRFNISICCPTQENVCGQPPNKGLQCEESPMQQVWMFDARERDCRPLAYTGCSGNDNRFETRALCAQHCRAAAICPLGHPLGDRNGVPVECNATDSCLAGYHCLRTIEGRYCCPKPEMVCSLPADVGTTCAPPNTPAAPPIIYWHFSPLEGTCVSFDFEGCGGNFNRFVTEEDCHDGCMPALCPAGRPKMIDGRLVHCSPSHHCGVGFNCQPARIGKDLLVCCPNPETLCVLPEDIGITCSAPHFRFRYDATTDRCAEFMHSGCAGNDNSFYTAIECRRFCARSYAQCPMETLPLSFPNIPTTPSPHSGRRPASCSPVYDMCAVGLRCSPSPATELHFCCPAARCASGRQPLHAPNGTAVSCRPSLIDGCPYDHSCQLVSDGQYLCCPRAEVSDACPPPSKVYVQAALPFACIPGDMSSVCPYGFTCRLNEAYGESFCCSDDDLIARTAPPPPAPSVLHHSKRLLNVEMCSDGAEPLNDALGVRICHPHLGFSCPQHYQCEFNRGIGRFQCCRADYYMMQSMMQDSRGVCPPGLTLQQHPKTHQPIVCQPGVSGFCPASSQCEYSTLYWQFICCAPAPPIMMGSSEFHDALVKTEIGKATTSAIGIGKGYIEDVTMVPDSSVSPAVSAFRQSRIDAPLFTPMATILPRFTIATESPPPQMKTFYPGDAGCQSDSQCAAAHPGSQCRDWICACPATMKVFEKTCVDHCPPQTEEREGRCARIYTNRVLIDT